MSEPAITPSTLRSSGVMAYVMDIVLTFARRMAWIGPPTVRFTSLDVAQTGGPLRRSKFGAIDREEISEGMRTHTSPSHEHLRVTMSAAECIEI